MTVSSKRTILIVVALATGIAAAHAQVPQSQPVTDSSAQASPVAQPSQKPGVVDESTQASPISEQHSGGLALAAHTTLHVTLTDAIDSGHLKNGQTVHARLATAVGPNGHAAFPAGTAASLTVVGAVPAGKLNAVGEMSLQLVKLGNREVDTEILTFRGQPGHKDLPDSAPATGTDAGLQHGAALTFHIQPPPAPAQGPPSASKSTPGSVTGMASGSRPSADSGQNGNSHGNQQGNFGQSSTPGTGTIPSGRTVTPMTPADTTPSAVENSGKVSVAPNQPAPPASSSSSTNPH